MKWPKMNIIVESPGLSWNWLKSIGINIRNVSGNLAGLACSERALGQCFYFGFRVVGMDEMNKKWSLSYNHQNFPGTPNTNRFQTVSGDSRVMFIFVHFVHSRKQGNISHFWVAGNFNTHAPLQLCHIRSIPGITTATKACFHVISILSQFCLMVPKSRSQDFSSVAVLSPVCCQNSTYFN